MALTTDGIEALFKLVYHIWGERADGAGRVDKLKWTGMLIEDPNGVEIEIRTESLRPILTSEGM